MEAILIVSFKCHMSSALLSANVRVYECVCVCVLSLIHI